MSIDYTVQFKARRPSVDDVLKVVQGFFGGALDRIEPASTPEARVIFLKGDVSFPFRELPDMEMDTLAIERPGRKGPVPRGFELTCFVDEAGTSEITGVCCTLRVASDEYMHVVVVGFLKCVARFWGGTYHHQS